MKRSAQVALTPGGETNVNHLRVPEFGILELRVKIGDKSSKCYLPKDSPKPKNSEEEKGKDDFHFAPEKETVKITYEIDDVCAVIEEAKLELFCRFREAPLWMIDLTKLGSDWYAHGKHVIEWDGRLPEQQTIEKAGVDSDEGLQHKLTEFDPKEIMDIFPDGYVTLEHTPYKLKLTVSNDKIKAYTAVAWTYFQILIKSIELDLGPEESVPAATVDDDHHKRDKVVRKRIDDDGRLPGEGVTRKVFLVSNQYKTNSNQMGTDTGFTRYETLWGKGPQIPLLAKIRLADSNDAEVKLEESDKGAVALGKVKFLWDWEDEDEAVGTANSQPKPRAYIKNAIDYYKAGTDATRATKDHTYPKGDNCHKDRAGKRGPDADPVFPRQDGYDAKDTLNTGKFPFKVEEGKERKWSVCSYGWCSGVLKGKTGVLFQPSRMAGDNYKVTVYLAYDKTDRDKWALDKKDEPLVAADSIKKTTGMFQIWREIHVVRYIRKLGSIGSFLPAQIGHVQALYRPAYIEVENKMESDDNYVLEDHRLANGNPPDYNAICEGIFNSSGNVLFTTYLAVAAGADHAGVSAAFKVRTYADFVAALHKTMHPPGFNDWGGGVTPQGLGVANLAGLPAGAKKARLTQTQTQLVTANLKTSAKYIRKLDQVMFPYAKKKLTNELQVVSGGRDGVGKAASEGITVLHFNNVHSAGSGGKLGSAIDPTDASGEKCVFLLTRSAVDTFVHEIGHHLFLAHAPTASGFKEETHDAADLNCMMSYTRPRLAFCGQCQLRLRGWKGSTLSKNSAANKKS